jgi:1,4-dihydroxy-2-naphthoyl-CoA hydrolase
MTQEPVIDEPAGQPGGPGPAAPAAPGPAEPASLPTDAQRADLGQLNRKVGITITSWDPRRVVGTMPVAGNRQPYGLLHGGASCVLAEALGSTAAALNAPPGRFALGLEINASHHRAVSAGTVTGVATPMHTGRTVATYQIEITDEAGRAVCTARLTCVLREVSEMPPGRLPTVPPAGR